METQALIITFSTLVGGGIGYFLRFILDRRKEALSLVYSERRKAYQVYVDFVLDMIGNSKNMNYSAMRTTIYKYYKESLLYASPRVTLALSNFFQTLYKSDFEKDKNSVPIMIKEMTTVFVEMRRDLGLGNKGLGEHGEALVRALFTDYDTIMKRLKESQEK